VDNNYNNLLFRLGRVINLLNIESTVSS